jgi:microcystin-dependent protein
MIEDGAFYSQAEAYALFRTPFIGTYVDCAYEPNPATHPELLPCYGQTVLVADYPDLFARLGTTYGGNGTTTFGIPDRRGRVLAGKDNMGGTSANRLTNQAGGLNGDVLGAAGGSETHVLTEGQLAAHDHEIAIAEGGAHSHTFDRGNSGTGTPSTAAVGNGSEFTNGTTSTASAHTHTGDIADAGSNQPHNNVQPTIIGVVCIIAF